MNTESKHLLKVLFKLKIYESDATAFEDLFTCIMVQTYPEFKRVKPYGKLGDRKNDGYIRHIGHYYQCYGPEDLTKKETIKRGVKKLSDDFEGLISYWNEAYEVKKFFYVVNDKYKGLPPDIMYEIDKMNIAYDSISIDSLCSDQLESIFIELPEDKYSSVILY